MKLETYKCNYCGKEYITNEGIPPDKTCKICKGTINIYYEEHSDIDQELFMINQHKLPKNYKFEQYYKYVTKTGVHYIK